jgi:hypothetical protein
MYITKIINKIITIVNTIFIAGLWLLYASILDLAIFDAFFDIFDVALTALLLFIILYIYFRNFINH